MNNPKVIDFNNAETPKQSDTNYPLDFVYAHELSDTYIPHDEIVEDVITAGAGSILYGDSNSGKTFLVIDMCCSIARGALWLGKRTEPGLVVYLATESPKSVQMRMQAYQKHYGVKVPNLVIVRNPINLFDGDADTNKIVDLVKRLESELGIKTVLIVGDTLAMMSAGANENAGQDMGVVVKHFQLIIKECDAHFMLIHHCGKNAAAGARGWSGVRAAVDTEIEVTDKDNSRLIEITKQRDLSTKGELIGFKLEPIHMGFSKWNKPVTSCFVVSTDAPSKAEKKNKSDWLSSTEKDVLHALYESIKKHGKEPPKEVIALFPDSPQNCPKKVVHREDFRLMAYPYMTVSEKSKRTYLTRYIEKFKELNKAMIYNDYLWIV